MRFGLLFLILSFVQLTSYAQDGASDTSHELLTPDAVETMRGYLDKEFTIQRFDDQKWQEIAGDADFNENRMERPKQGDGRSIPWGGPWLKMVSYLVVIGIVIALLYYITKNVYFDLKIKRTTLDTHDFERTVENIEELDVQDLLDKARQEGNFKLAVRLHYLRLLKRLHESGVIAWKKNKTNRDYLYELFSRDFYYDDMQGLTLAYEAVWYGDHALKPESFQRLSDHFEVIYQKINAVPKS